MYINLSSDMFVGNGGKDEIEREVAKMYADLFRSCYQERSADSGYIIVTASPISSSYLSCAHISELKLMYVTGKTTLYVAKTKFAAKKAFKKSVEKFPL
jgi:hypothetical protein